MRKLLIIAIFIILLMIVLWYLPYITTKNLISVIDVENTHIYSIRDGSGDLIEINESLEISIINSLSDLTYRPTVNFLPRGGWSFMIKMNYVNNDHVVVISEVGWVRIDGKKYQVDRNKDWENLIISLNQ
ncbi:hypothetical protein RJG79_01750 [Mycoplasmatota bacterium WC44]